MTKSASLFKGVALAAVLSAGVLLAHGPLFGAEAPVILPPPAEDVPKAAGHLQKAVLAGGCFWGVQGVFEHVRGVRKVLAGYSGGERRTATYDSVSTGRTGHAESVEISYDPAVVSYGEILQVAFSVVSDPTQLNRQGPDAGTQYRSAVFYADEQQRHIAEAYIAQLEAAHVFARPIVTRLEQLDGFYPAEGYHQDYLINNPDQPYIAYYDLPKLENFRKIFPALYSGRPVLARN